MRILSIIAQKPHATGSGVYLSGLVRALDRLGCAQAVAAGVYPEDRVEFPEGVEFFPVYFKSEGLPFPMPGMSDEMPYESTVYRAMAPDMAARFLDAFIGQIRRAADSFRPDVIICHHLYLLTARVREEFPDKKIFGVCHGTDLRQLDKTPLWRDYIPGLIARLDRIFCLHREQRQAISQRFGLPGDGILVVGSGYDSGIFRPLPTQRSRAHSLAFAGKISEKKGVFSLIRALGHLPYPPGSLRLYLAGGYADAGYAAAMELIGRCPYPVELMGSLSQRELAELFNRCGLFILPSFYEGLPLVLAEAMACGAKVICTDLPGIRPWMDAHAPGHGIRFIAPPAMLDADTPEPSALPAFERDLAAAIQEALESPPQPLPDLSQLSWDRVGRVFLDAAKG